MPRGKVTLVKGEAILSEFGWIRHKKGDAGVQKVLDDLNEGRSKVNKTSVKDFEKTKWYPVETQYKILQSIKDNFGNGDPTIVKGIGRYGVKKIAQFGFVLRFLKVQTVTEKMGDNVMMLYRTLELVPKYPDDNTVEIATRGFPVDPLYCNLLLGGIEQMGKVLKLKNLVVDEKTCQMNGDDYCTYRMRFD